MATQGDPYPFPYGQPFQYSGGYCPHCGQYMPWYKSTFTVTSKATTISGELKQDPPPLRPEDV